MNAITEMQTLLKSIVDAASAYGYTAEEAYDEAMNILEDAYADGKVSSYTYKDVLGLLESGDTPSWNIKHIADYNYAKTAVVRLRNEKDQQTSL